MTRQQQERLYGGVQRRYETGEPVADIAKAVGFSVATVYNVASQMGLKRDHSAVWKQPKVTRREVNRLLSQGLSIAQVADKLATTDDVVDKYFDEEWHEDARLANRVVHRYNRRMPPGRIAKELGVTVLEVNKIIDRQKPLNNTQRQNKAKENSLTWSINYRVLHYGETIEEAGKKLGIDVSSYLELEEL